MTLRTRKREILVVDDSELDREKIRRYLNRNPDVEFEIFELDGIEKAAEFIKNHTLDCIILDYRLPDGESIEFMSQNKDIPIIIVTEYGSEKIVTEILRKGASDYISKSDINIDSINRIVLSVIERYDWEKKSKLHQEELKNFASQIAHDLQNPLNGIVGYSDLLSESTNLSHKEQNMIDNIKDSATRMSNLINSLLKYSTLEFDKRDFKQVDLNEIFSSIQDELKSDINEIGGDLNFSKLPKVKGIDFRLKQLFKNIIENSIKYRQKENALKISVSITQQDNDYVEISVADNGKGFEQKHATKIFSPFSRLENTNISGHGIGLATCRRIVSQHGGSIRAESKVGVGTTFFITFLLYSDSEPV